MDRLQELRKHIGKDQRGIEIGAYHSPLAPRRQGFQSITLDVFDANELRRRAQADPHVPVEYYSNIEDVDLVGSAVELDILVEQKFGNERFDYVISSHNFEHLANPIKFLQACEKVLKPGAVLSMAIPDRRYCYDFYRPVTDLSEWLDAYQENRIKPTPSQVFRARAYYSILEDQHAWDPETAGIPSPRESLELAYADWRRLTEVNGSAPYEDAHCSVFTPASFELMIADLNYLKLVKMKTLTVSEPNRYEFYVHLRNISDDEHVADREHFYQNRAEIMRRAAQEAATYIPVKRLQPSPPRRRSIGKRWSRSIGKRFKKYSALVSG